MTKLRKYNHQRKKPDLIPIESDNKDSNNKVVIAEEEEETVAEKYGGYQTRTTNQVTRLIPTLSGKTYNSVNIHLKQTWLRSKWKITCSTSSWHNVH